MTLRNGMWVRTGVGVGVYVNEAVAVDASGNRRLVNAASPLNEGERLEREPWVHLVNKDGTTLAQLPAANCGAIEQAKAEDIPASRVDHLSSERLAAFGYL